MDTRFETTLCLTALIVLLVAGCQPAPTLEPLADAPTIAIEDDHMEDVMDGHMDEDAVEDHEDDVMMDDDHMEDVMDDHRKPTEGDEPDMVFSLTGENFLFRQDGVENPDLRVHKGDSVRIEFTSISGFHDWRLDEFGAVTERVRDGDSTYVEFVADESGTFEYYCSVGSHRQMGMRGDFIVE